MKVRVSTLMFWFTLATMSVGATEITAPDILVRDLYSNWIQTAQSQREVISKDKHLLYSLTEEATTPYIDFKRLSRLVLGKYWRQASAEQRERFIKEFRHYLVRTYATAMIKYIDAEFVFKPTKFSAQDKHVVVRTKTIPKDGRPSFPMNYIVYRDDSSWKVMDVTIEGISIVATLRNVVRSEIQQKSLDHVIEDIAEKNRQVRQ